MVFGGRTARKTKLVYKFLPERGSSFQKEVGGVILPGVFSCSDRVNLRPGSLQRVHALRMTVIERDRGREGGKEGGRDRGEPDGQT